MEIFFISELYEICLNRAKDRLKLMQESGDSDSICSQGKLAMTRDNTFSVVEILLSYIKSLSPSPG